MSEKKTREFWINNSSNVDNFDREFWMAFKIPNHPDSGEVHVIEKSAYDELVRALEKVAALCPGTHRDEHDNEAILLARELTRKELKQAVVSKSGSDRG